ncbi:hypothetical protein T484DRAFT_1761984 [Baffinella frigidus]|nr:hypothetical protein T484DRAFT_1761984 [Cryptophyta sp. CCMP2293]
MSSARLTLTPQLFWAGAALLHSARATLFLPAAHLMDTLIAKLDLADPCTQDLLFATLPNDWSPAYQGLKPLVLRVIPDAGLKPLVLRGVADAGLKPLVLRGVADARTHAAALALALRVVASPGGLVLDTTPRHTPLCVAALLPRLAAMLDRAPSPARGVTHGGNTTPGFPGVSNDPEDEARGEGAGGGWGQLAGVLAEAAGMRGMTPLSEAGPPPALFFFFITLDTGPR